MQGNFEKYKYNNEDDVKLHFYSDIVKPLLEVLNPASLVSFKSENRLVAGGRTDATFQNISFEYKALNHFHTQKGIEEALYGRDDKDHGLYDYILSNSEITNDDTEETTINKILHGIGVGFDGKHFIFARFVPSTGYNELMVDKITSPVQDSLPIKFTYEIKSFSEGLKKLAILFRQYRQRDLTKNNLIEVFGPKNQFVRDCIMKIYQDLNYNLDDSHGSTRVRTLYDEWDQVFGTIYGEENQVTDFHNITPYIRELYGIREGVEIDSKRYLLALQTFFNIFLKLLVYSFLKQLINPLFTVQRQLSKVEVNQLFEGVLDSQQKPLVDNFFECHFLEWFTFTSVESNAEVEIVNSVLSKLSEFDIAAFQLKPETIHDILQELYMELIPHEMRHVLGEYFSPDWIVEHALDMVEYDGSIDKSLIDPTCGSGSFLTHAIKLILDRKGEKNFDIKDVRTIVHNIVGFDINPISVTSAKANYILSLLSSCTEETYEELKYNPIRIPVYIADSILAPVVYSEESSDVLTVDTTQGSFVIPKFDLYDYANDFLQRLSRAIYNQINFERFWNEVNNRNLIADKYKSVVKELFDKLFVLHRAGNDSFWPIVLKNSFAPILIGNKFDFVVGNPPWIAWKKMSRSYRDGTLEVWKSYGIFEKNAYDKKTTHDDFGMAVTYVSVDKYLKMDGKMVFLLPATFLKSTKGGEGFRKLSITRKGQNIPFSILQVDDFSDVRLFTTNTIAVKILKGKQMEYPLKNYNMWSQIGKKVAIDSHASWDSVNPTFSVKKYYAQPVDSNDLQSAWLTMPAEDLSFADHVLNPTKPRFYQGRKGIEPAGAKGVFILKKPIRMSDGTLAIENDIARQRRADFLEKGAKKGHIEETHVYPMLGGRNIDKWKIKSNEFMLVPHTSEYKYGIPVNILEKTAGLTEDWLHFYYQELLDSRIQNGKFFNPETQPYYRLDNVGEYTFTKYKVLWKEQSQEMSAVVASTYLESIPGADPTLFSEDKVIVVDSKVLMLGTNNELEAYYVCGIINCPLISNVIDSYAVSLNRGTDVLKYIAIPKYNSRNDTHVRIAEVSKEIHYLARKNKDYEDRLDDLNSLIKKLFLE